MGSLATAVKARFAGFELDFRSGELARNGRRVRLQEQPFRVLRLLLDNAGEVVSREELQHQLWSQETFVDFDHGLNKAIGKLREALDNPVSDTSLIETLPRRGYRFKSQVEWIGADRDPLLVGPESPARRHSPFGRRFVIAAVVLASLVAGLLLLNRHRILAWLHPLPVMQSIAVLPLQNLSGDPEQEYFADGTTEELITMLAKSTDLKVISRTSSMRMRGVQKSMREIGRELGVDAVVEGSVTRSPQTIRITVQLIDVRSDRHLWAEEFEGPPSEIFQLQRKVALAIASQVSAKTSLQEHANRLSPKPINPDAQDLYLRARFHAAQGTDASLRKSIELYQ
ncbi:MAG TPA: winged helix-turn-helix domain-containing protein, partial [Candidatus Angelobacter sp.]|nr:winged helix-turn-helix domain-containing protein [Candidatus Angelobacter sp.]